MLNKSCKQIYHLCCCQFIPDRVKSFNLIFETEKIGQREELGKGEGGLKPSQYQTKVAITEFKSSVEAPLSTSNLSLKQGWRSSTPLEINLCPISNYTTRLFQPYFKPGPKFQTLSQPTINHLEKTKKLNESSLLPWIIAWPCSYSKFLSKLFMINV